MDKYQLPPIKENLSKCFSENNIVELTEIVRQEVDNPLIKLLTILREDVDNSSSKFLDYLRENPIQLDKDGNGYEVCNEDDFKGNIKTIFNDKAFEKDVDFVRFTSWTNADIKKWNNFIRTNILDDTVDIVTKDDLFTGYTTIVDEFLKPIITNSDDYIIGDIIPRQSDYKFKIYFTELKSLNSLRSTMVNIVDHLDPSFVNYYNILNNLHFNAVYCSPHQKGKKWREYYEFKNKYLSLIDFNLFTKGDERVRGKVTKDLDYGYGLTTHKSQGSTYENVFVNINNMLYWDKSGVKRPIVANKFNPNAIEFRNKLIYVACSRASKKAILLL